jgi:hypothetical protein
LLNAVKGEVKEAKKAVGTSLEVSKRNKDPCSAFQILGKIKKGSRKLYRVGVI